MMWIVVLSLVLLLPLWLILYWIPRCERVGLLRAAVRISAQSLMSGLTLPRRAWWTLAPKEFW